MTDQKVKVKSKFKIILLLMVSQPVYPGIRPPSGTHGQFFFLFHGHYLQTFTVFSMECPL
jgi:hypothetical protein